MYLEEGYTADMIPSIILENNIFGLDVDKRAIQLTSFALTMKARSYDKGLFKNGYHFPNVVDVHESNSMTDNDVDTMAKLLELSGEEKEVLKECVFRFKNAEYYGSLINNFEYGADVYKSLLEKISNKEESVDFGDIFESAVFNKFYILVCILVKQAMFMSSKYDCVVTNPPYLNPGSCGDEMKKYASKYYPDSKADMCAMFIERCMEYVNLNGLQAMITMHSWMFLGSYEKLRKKLINTTTMISMAHLGPRAFEDIGGEVVQTTSWVMRLK
jgi:type I restriction-modification system DNA methylase subunit